MLKAEVGTNAGRIWRLLDSRESHSGLFKEIGKELGLSTPDLMLALGWLAKEDKVLFSEPDEKKKDVKVSLVMQSDFYF